MPRRSTLVVPLLLLLSTDAWGLRFYVDPDPTKGDDRRSIGAAQNSDTPFRTITQALRIAHMVPEGRPHVIEIPAVSYSPSMGETFPLVISQADIFIEVDGDRAIFDAEGKSNFFQVTAPGSEFLIKGFRFLNGDADKGGVAFCQSCSLRVTDSRFSNNRATSGGQLVYVEDGRLRFFNNEIPGDSNQVPGVALLDIHNTLPGTSQRDEIRNNTFFNNATPAIRTSSNRVDINSNIFSEQAAPVIIDESTVDDPLIRFNIFWELEILFISDVADSIKLTRTIIDTLTLAEQGLEVPSFVLTTPDTLMLLGETYDYLIDVGDHPDFHVFTPLILPSGASFDDVAEFGRITWTPTEADLGRSQVSVRLEDPFGLLDTLKYPLHVFTAETFPDTTDPDPVITVTVVPDTTGAVEAINALVPVFSSAASSGDNLVADPLLFKPSLNNFQLKTDSPAIAAGDSTVALKNASGRPNDRGSLGGPANSGVPEPGSFSELVITTLPDSIAVEGQTYTYDPALDPVADIIWFVDFVQGPLSFKSALGGAPPITWVPALADTGSYQVGVIVSTPQGEGRHFFDLRVKPANEPPVVSSTPVTTTLEDELYAYLIEATDPNGDAISYSLLTGPPGLSVDESGLVGWTPAQEHVGESAVEIRLEDPKGAGSTHRYTLQVLNVNDPPVFTSQSPAGTIAEDAPFAHTLVAADPDPGDALTFFLQAGPAAVSVDPAGIVTWTPGQADVGTVEITVGVRDAEGVAATQAFTLEVLQVDDPPFISSEPETVAFEDSLYRYVIEAVDEEGGGVTLTLDAGTTGLTFADTGVGVEWVPASADTGLHSVSITALDSSGLTRTQAWVIDVEAVNDAPFILSRDPVDSLVAAEAGVSVVLSVVAEDEEADAIGVRWLLNQVAQSSAAGLFFAHTPAVDAVDTVTVELSDGSDTTTVFWILDTRLIPQVGVPTDLVDFGRVPVGSTGRVQLQVANDGRGDLSIDSVKVADLQFSAIFTATTIPAADTTALELRFTPTQRGLSEDAISFITNDPERLRLQIPVKGTGVVPTQLSLDLDPASGSQGQLSGSARPGDEIAVAIYAAEALQLSAYGLELSFDTGALNFTGFDAAGAEEENLLAAAGNSLVPSAAATGGVVRIEVATESGGAEVTGDGLLGILRLSVDPATEKTSAEIRLDLGSLRSAGVAAADTVLPDVTATLEIQLLVGDFNFDGKVDIIDFFQFADAFGSADPVFDLSGNGLVDLSDFFIFSDNFGTSLGKSVGALPAGSTELSMSLVGGGGGEQLEIKLSQRAGQPVRGLMLQLVFDPEILRMSSFQGPEQGRERFPLRAWIRGNTDGAATLLAGGGPVDLPAGQGGDLGAILFERRSGDGGVVRVSAAVVQTPGRAELLIETPQSLRFPALPADFVLYPAYPNPFNPETTLRFFLPQSSHVSLRVFDLTGRAVRVLVETRLSSGFQALVWDGRDQLGRAVGSGVYLVEMRAAGLRRVRKLMLIK